MDKLIYILLISISLSSCSKVNEFDLVCDSFDKLVVENNKNKLSSKEKYFFVNKIIESNLPHASAAKESWKAIIGFIPAEGRYNMYKNAAEITLKDKWQCLSMKALLKDI